MTSSKEHDSSRAVIRECAQQWRSGAVMTVIIVICTNTKKPMHFHASAFVLSSVS
jgi:aconitase A